MNFDLKPVLGTSVLVSFENQVLLAQRGKEPSRGLWSLPGGKVEWQETLEFAAIREIKEETGIRIKNLHFAEFVEIIREKYHFVIAVFIVHLDVKPHPQAGDDASDARWFTLDEINAMDKSATITPGTAERIHRLCNQ